jgi:hypothetical protein
VAFFEASSHWTFFVEGVEIEIGMPDALPWIRKDVDVVRMHQLSFYILILWMVVLWPGEVAQEPQVGNGLEQQERTLAALTPDKLLRPVLAGLLREQERDEAVLEAPVPLVVAILHELDRMREMLFDLREAVSFSGVKRRYPMPEDIETSRQILPGGS